jgi:hypothetical protein
VRVVLAAGLAGLLVWIGVGGLHTAVRLTGSNGIGNEQFVAVVGPRERLCQLHESVPANTRSLRMTIGTYGRRSPPLQLTVLSGPRDVVPAGRLAAGWKEGIVEIPLGAQTTKVLPDVSVCVVNGGGGRLAVAGAQFGRDTAALVGAHRAAGRVRIEYAGGEARSTWSLAGRIASRMTFGRGLWDGLAPWAALAFVLLAVAAALRALPGATGPRGRP